VASSVDFDGKFLLVSVPYNSADMLAVQKMPQRRWVPTKKVWQGRPSLQNLLYLEQALPGATWSQAAKAEFNQSTSKEKQRHDIRTGKDSVDLSVLKGVPFRVPPMEHQKKGLVLGRDQMAFAYLMDPGTGKTKLALDDAAHNWRSDRIDAVLVLAPNSVKTNWVSWDGDDAVDQHMAPDVPVIKGVWISDAGKSGTTKWKGFEKSIQGDASGKLIVLVCNYDAISIPRVYKFLELFCTTFRTMIIADESTRLGTPGSVRTKTATKLRKLCRCARILTGTPVIKSPLKAYSQFAFLDEDCLGFGSYYSFRNHFCNLGGFKGKQVLSYRNLDQLAERIASCSYRVTKKECLDLPPQIYLKRYVHMTKEQLSAYEDMRKKMLAEHQGETVEARIVLTQMLRMQQITGGYLTDGDKVLELVKPAANPKLNEAMAIVDEAPGQVVVWCRFIPEIKAMAGLLDAAGVSFIEFHGGVPEKERQHIRQGFKSGTWRVLLGNAAAGGIGIDEFKVADTVIYISNSCDTEQRKQSEDRTHRIGSEQHEKITYYDIIVPNTVDVKIVQVMRRDGSVSAEIMRDGINQWI
jgi:hypothetical protein